MLVVATLPEPRTGEAVTLEERLRDGPALLPIPKPDTTGGKKRCCTRTDHSCWPRNEGARGDPG